MLNINTIFNYTEPNIIANILLFELDVIINSIAPKHRIQVRKNYSPYVNKKLKIEHNLKNQLYSQAIETNDQENF